MSTGENIEVDTSSIISLLPNSDGNKDMNSRQSAWQEKMVKEGRCRQCGKTSFPGYNKCNKCLNKQRLQARRYYKSVRDNRKRDKKMRIQ